MWRPCTEPRMGSPLPGRDGCPVTHRDTRGNQLAPRTACPGTLEVISETTIVPVKSNTTVKVSLLNFSECILLSID